MAVIVPAFVRAYGFGGQDGDHAPANQGLGEGRSPSLRPARYTNNRVCVVLGRDYQRRLITHRRRNPASTEGPVMLSAA